MNMCSCAPNVQAVPLCIRALTGRDLWDSAGALNFSLDEWTNGCRGRTCHARRCATPSKKLRTRAVPLPTFFFFSSTRDRKLVQGFASPVAVARPRKRAYSHVAADRSVSTCERQPQTSRIEDSFFIFFVRYCTLVPFDRTLSSLSLNNVTAI